MMKFTSEITVKLIQHCGSDASAVAAAKVSTEGIKSVEHLDEEANRGLIRYLMKQRHGCYDSKTEVLTSKGWKKWPKVDGSESFVTLSVDNQIEYQQASRLVRKHYEGPMISVKMAGVDLLVTPDHNVLAGRRRHGSATTFGLVAAKNLSEASHRMLMGGGKWGGIQGIALAKARLLGFFIGDGCNRPSCKIPVFKLRKRRKIRFLAETCAKAGFKLQRSGDRFYVRCGKKFRNLTSDCYDKKRSKQIPRCVLEMSPLVLSEVLIGLMNSDGHTSKKGKETYSTTSSKLAGQIQELVLKCGRTAVVAPHPFTNDPGHFGGKDRYRVTIYQERNSKPRIGWTSADRAKQVKEEQYSGDIHCVTVPNGTLYVRRNGKPLWCGNSPFEHAFVTFFVHAPIFVWREWHRHRIGHSFNEESGRYKTLEPVFYIPEYDRPMMKVDDWKPGRPKFLYCKDSEVHLALVSNLKASYGFSYNMYLDNLKMGIDPGLARDCLPVGIYSSCWVSINPRSAMAFLSLRTHEPDAKFPSYPLYEIEQAARLVEEEFARLFPITYAAFNEFGRVAP